MAQLDKFRSLSVSDRILVATAVLYDGLDAVDFLGGTDQRSQAMAQVAKDLVSLPPDIRVPLVATLLRENSDSLKRKMA